MNKQRIALVTGAATGIGRACAENLARSGFTVAANYRTKKGEMEQVLSALDGGSHTLFQGDLSDPDTAPSLTDAVVGQYGQLDVLVNAAGTFAEHNIADISFADCLKALRHTLATNLEGPMNLAFCAAKQMIQQGNGTIINITSRGAFRGEPEAPAYGASKAGLNSVSQSLAKALAPHGISVFAIAPGWVETPLASPYLMGAGGESIRAQSPLNRVGRPEEIAHMVSFLAEGKTEYLTGAIIDMNGASYLRN